MEDNINKSDKSELTRRQFVGLAASGATALTILPSFTISGLGHIAPSDKLYIAVVGCGGEGAADIQAFMKTPKKNAVISHLCDMDGHYWQWIDACIAGYGKAEVDSPFEGYAGPLTETVLMGNLLLRSFNIREKIKRKDPVYGDMEGFVFPGRYINFKWDGPNMRITNFEAANQFVKREYRKGWGELKSVNNY